MNDKALNNKPAPQRDSFSELLGRLANQSAAVFHDEIEFVIQGIREKLRAVRSGVLTVVIAAIICFAAFMCFCAALVIGLTSYMTPVMAALVTGGGLALIGGAIALIGYKKLKSAGLKT
jgi:hypothetical protein